jgi:hypothetical protein
MLRLSLLDDILIFPLDSDTNFQYWILAADGTVILTGVSAGESHILVPITLAVFENYLNKSIIVKIVTSTPNTYYDMVLLSGIQNKLSLLCKIAGILGKNKKIEVTDTQDGHILSQTETVYTDNTFTEEQFTFNHEKAYVQDFIPDHRFFLQEEYLLEDV